MKKLVTGGAVLISVVMIVLIALIGGAMSTDDAAAATCSAGQVATVDPNSIDTLDGASHGNAQTVIDVGAQLQIPGPGVIIALMVGLQESTLHNLANSTVPESFTYPHDGVGSDHDSVGIMQQRPSWGTVAERMTPATAAQRFYERLASLPHWQQMSANDAAQAVQISGVPDAYGKWEQMATQLLQSAGGAVDAGCTAAGALSTATGDAGVAVRSAQAKIGTSYVFGGDCSAPQSADPSTHCDCSSLVMTAWADAGHTLPRTSEGQWLAVQIDPDADPSKPATLVPGELLFYEWGEDGLEGPGHVAMYVGDGNLIEAPQPGQDVSERPVYTDGFVGAGTVK